jgi:hypothetical protein
VPSFFTGAKSKTENRVRGWSLIRYWMLRGAT